MKILLLIIMTVVVFFSCKKGIEHDQQYIRGRVFFTDTITGNKREVPASNKKVLLSRVGDSLNYIYSTTTDKEGYFTFDLLSDDEDHYTLFSYDTLGTYYYKGRVDAKRGDKNVALLLSLNQNAQNALVVYAKDPSNSVLPTVSLKVYNNLNLAVLNDSASAFARIRTDSNGKGYLFNLPVGDYYINADKVIDTVTYQRFLKKIHVGATGFTVDTLMLARKSVQNGFVLMLKDTLSGSIPFANVRLYNSLVLALNDDSTAAVGKFVSDASGKVTKTNMDAGPYYLNATKISGSDTFRRMGKLMTVPASGLVMDTMILSRGLAVLQNGFTIETKDSLHGIMPVTSLYLFTSSVLASQSISTGAIRTVNTDEYGKVSFYNLPAGNYYLNAQKVINDSLTFERLVKPLTIPGTGMVRDTVVLHKKIR